MLVREIRLCVTEVGKRVNYDDATRVVHHVIEAGQKNLAEQEIRINALVFLGEGNAAESKYGSTCMTRGSLKIVRFEIAEIAGQRHSVAL